MTQSKLITSDQLTLDSSNTAKGFQAFNHTIAVEHDGAVDGKLFRKITLANGYAITGYGPSLKEATDLAHQAYAIVKSEMQIAHLKLQVELLKETGTKMARQIGGSVQPAYDKFLTTEIFTEF